MTDLDFERRMNPGLFDSTGTLTDQARKQFPDLGSDPAPIAFGASGAVLSVQPAVLVQASGQALDLAARVRTECGQPELNATAAVTALTGWDTSAALNTAWSVWSQQVQNLAGAVGQIGQNLQGNATNYTNGEQHNQRRFAGE
ncbi:WXG100 family type VII secretion target [Kitasatospora mediocidica]|uniref:WXG100 family type VII secretion target n=1 Tax=Kitasatospora mediocidica TaxID=58352 RepID=UPI0005644F5F|nr:type VII secretion target [Kitasatospora mediocidica]